MSVWISVKERLPEMKEPYPGGPMNSGNLLLFNGHYVTFGRYEETYKKRDRVWKGRFGYNENVTHWMPLPEPPKEEA